MNAEATEKTNRVYRPWPTRWWAAPILLLAAAQAPAEPFDSLKKVPVPKPDNLAEFVKACPQEPGGLCEKALVQLGKALFWDMQVGSDGVQACGTCHAAAGADPPRATNQISPGLLKQPSPPGDTIFQVGGPNYTLKSTDFPFTKFDNPNVPNDVPFGAPPFNELVKLSDTNDVASSQGVLNTKFGDAGGGSPVDRCDNVHDEVFQKNGYNTRRVEPRNTPTFHNAVFNFRNFWDGRAQNEFNGVNPFGTRDPDACVFKATSPGQPPQCVKIVIKNCSQCSQAVGPPRSFFEMSCGGRPFAEIGQKLTNSTIVPLGKQKVCSSDSVIGSIANSTSGCTQKGLKTTYAALIQKAFRPEFWSSPVLLKFNPGSELSNDVIPGPGNFSPATPSTPQYTLMEANFSLFFGLSVGRYMATTVADDTPADKFADAGRTGTALTPRQKLGLQVFEGKGLCANCHGGPETTNASVRNVANQHLERMQMGFRPTDGGCVDKVGINGRCIAVYDNGFYNIGARPTTDDIGVGGRDPFGNPLSETEFCQQRVGTNNPCQPELTCIDERPEEGIFCDAAGAEFCAQPPPVGVGLPAPGAPKRCPLKGPGETPLNGEIIAVDGNFKTPHLRNLFLTGPYFHNGGKSTLEQVVRAYNHGLDFRDLNQKDLDPDIEADLALTEPEITALVDFLACGLLDKRVAYKKAPFDQPEIFIPKNHMIPVAAGDGNTPAPDNLLQIPASGAGGVTAKLRPFLYPSITGPGAGVTCRY